MRVTLVGLSLVLLLVLGSLAGRAQEVTPSSEGCRGIAAYVEAREDIIGLFDDYRLSPVMFPSRDPLTLSNPEWEKAVELTETAQAQLATLDSPPILAEWHVEEVRELGAQSAFAREAIRNGAKAAEAGYSEALSEQHGKTSDAFTVAVKACPELLALASKAQEARRLRTTTPTPTPVNLSCEGFDAYMAEVEAARAPFTTWLQEGWHLEPGAQAPTQSELQQMRSAVAQTESALRRITPPPAIVEVHEQAINHLGAIRDFAGSIESRSFDYAFAIWGPLLTETTDYENESNARAARACPGFQALLGEVVATPEP